MFLTRLCGYISPILRAPIHIVVIIHLIQLRRVFPRALNRSVNVAVLHQRFPDLGICVRCRGAGHDARVLEECVCVQNGEQLQRLLDVIHHLLRGHVVDVAGRVEGADAGAVFAPFVLPEGLVVAPVVFPVDRHVVEQVVAVEVLEDLSDVCILAAFVAVLLVGSVTFVGPSAS